jgi:hypothetical protein
MSSIALKAALAAMIITVPLSAAFAAGGGAGYRKSPGMRDYQSPNHR